MPIIIAVVVPVATVAALAVGLVIWQRRKRAEMAFDDMMTPTDGDANIPPDPEAAVVNHSTPIILAGAPPAIPSSLSVSSSRAVSRSASISSSHRGGAF